MKRRALVAGNWKMNTTVVEATMLSQDICNRYYNDYDNVETVLCPPFISLKSVATVLDYDKSDIALGAQDVFWEKSGAYTGAISPQMLKAVGCRYCIVGHSERREYFGESNNDVGRKAKALLSVDITPIVCVGEGIDVREVGAGEALDFVVVQVAAALESIDFADVGRIVVAYEPIWAIGTGRTATPEIAQDMCAGIRACIADIAGADAANKVRILYGGSMKPENAASFAPEPDIDGGLIGGAALKSQDFLGIVKAFI